jgi:hypothetical protein
MQARSRTPRRGRRGLLIAVSSAVAAVSAGTAIAPAEAAILYKTTYPVPAEATNPCNGEEVTLSGTAHEEAHATYNGDGSIHSTFHVNWSGVSGSGNLGNKYRAASTDIEILNEQVAYEQTVTVTERFVSQGSAPNFTVRDQFHITVNADGTLTSSHHNVSPDPDCKG